jgi:hypothetical protein
LQQAIIGESAVKASDMDEEPAPLVKSPSAREWLRLVGAAIAVVLICVLWTFWV